MTTETIQLAPWDGDHAPAGSEQFCDGAGDDLEATASTPQSRGWGSGWPNCQTSKLVTITVPGRVRLSVHRDIAPLVGWLSAETVRRGYHFRSGQCWGFACRAIRGSSSPSNHSWGLAVDINSLANPMGSSLITDMPSWMTQLWTSKGFRWGGTYSSRKDAMHYEFMGTPQDAARTIASLGVATPQDTSSGFPAAGTAPAFPLPAGHCFGKDEDSRTHSGRQPADRPRIAQLQRRMIDRGWSLGSAGADGIFGTRTHEAVTAFQQEKRLTPDGLVGSRTWPALWTAPIT